jgi:glycosyltransferase involved in cell wall biosynthesis
MKVMAACDVGLIFLDHRFTIPNFPSRLLSYMEGKMPVLAATDPNTDVGTVIEEGEFGYWCESNDSEKFVKLMNRFSDYSGRHKMGENAYQFLINHYDVSRTYQIIISHVS